MDVASFVSFLEQNKVGLHLDMDGRSVLKVKQNGKNVDIEINDIEGLKKLRKVVKKWRG